MFFKELETERLYLKNISYDDDEFIFKQFSTDDITRYMYDEEPYTNIEGAKGIMYFYTEPEPRNQHRWMLKIDL